MIELDDLEHFLFVQIKPLLFLAAEKEIPILIKTNVWRKVMITRITPKRIYAAIRIPGIKDVIIPISSITEIRIF